MIELRAELVIWPTDPKATRHTVSAPALIRRLIHPPCWCKLNNDNLFRLRWKRGMTELTSGPHNYLYFMGDKQ
jgi:hypothetical protein